MAFVAFCVTLHPHFKTKKMEENKIRNIAIIAHRSPGTTSDVESAEGATEEVRPESQLHMAVPGSIGSVKEVAQYRTNGQTTTQL